MCSTYIIDLDYIHTERTHCKQNISSNTNYMPNIRNTRKQDIANTHKNKFKTKPIKILYMHNKIFEWKYKSPTR